MPEFGEIPLESAIKSAAKKNEATGLNVQRIGENFLVSAVDGTKGGFEQIGSYLGSLKTLEGVTPGGATIVLEAISDYLEEPGYDDLIMFGPPKVGPIEDRMKRLQEIRDKVTAAQTANLTGSGIIGKDRPGLVKAAIFVRSQLPTLGLKTTVNILRSFSEKS